MIIINIKINRQMVTILNSGRILTLMATDDIKMTFLFVSTLSV